MFTTVSKLKTSGCFVLKHACSATFSSCFGLQKNNCLFFVSPKTRLILHLALNNRSSVVYCKLFRSHFFCLFQHVIICVGCWEKLLMFCETNKHCVWAKYTRSFGGGRGGSLKKKNPNNFFKKKKRSHFDRWKIEQIYNFKKWWRWIWYDLWPPGWPHSPKDHWQNHIKK